MIPHKLNPLGIDRDYPLMNFEKDGNLFDINSTLNSFLYSNGDGTYTSTWLADGRSGGWFSVDIKAGEKFTVSANIISSTSTGNTLCFQGQHTDGTYPDWHASQTGNYYAVITATKDISMMRIYFSNTGTVQGQYTIFKDFMIKKGTVTAYPTYQPYNPNTYSVLGQSTQEIRSLSKNLFDKSKVTLDKYITTIGVISTSFLDTISDYIPIKANTTYCKNNGKEYVLFNLSKEYMAGGTSRTFTPTQDGFVRMTVAKDTLDTFQLELGVVETPYQPFVPLAPSPSPQYPSPIISNYPKGVYKTPWGYIRLYEDLRGIGDVRDKIVYDTSTREKTLTKNITNYVLKGDEGWDFVESDVEVTRFFTTVQNNKTGQPDTEQNLISDNFECKSWKDKYSVSNNVHTYSGDNRIGICISNAITGIIDADTSTIKSEKLKYWLSTHNTEVAYLLETPLQQEL